MDCEICNVQMNSVSSVRLHINGKKHGKAINKLKQQLDTT